MELLNKLVEQIMKNNELSEFPTLTSYGEEVEEILHNTMAEFIEYEFCVKYYVAAKFGHDDVYEDRSALQDRLKYWTDGDYKNDGHSDYDAEQQIHCLKLLLQ